MAAIQRQRTAPCLPSTTAASNFPRILDLSEGLEGSGLFVPSQEQSSGSRDARFESFVGWFKVICS